MNAMYEVVERLLQWVFLQLTSLLYCLQTYAIILK